MNSLIILSANLGNFDTPVEPVPQTVPVDYHCFTDEDFPPITGLTARLQYRIPKLFGWQMKPGYPYYIWLDGAVTMLDPDSVKFYLEQLGENDMAFFKHPSRKTAREEVDHIEEHLQAGKPYITSRYKNGLHKEQLQEMYRDPTFKDEHLWASTGFIYRNTDRVQGALADWWMHQSRYFTCDQVVLPYVVHRHNLRIKTMKEKVFKSKHIYLVSNHR